VEVPFSSGTSAGSSRVMTAHSALGYCRARETGIGSSREVIQQCARPRCAKAACLASAVRRCPAITTDRANDAMRRERALPSLIASTAMPLLMLLAARRRRAVTAARQRRNPATMVPTHKPTSALPSSRRTMIIAATETAIQIICSAPRAGDDLQNRRERASMTRSYRPLRPCVKRFQQRRYRLAKPLLATVKEQSQDADNSGSLGTLRDP